MITKSLLFGVLVLICTIAPLTIGSILKRETSSLVTTTESSDKSDKTSISSSDVTKEPKRDLQPSRIYEMHMETNITNRYSKTLVTSKVSNVNSKSQEATFSIVIPENAFISGFIMEIGGKKYEAYIKSKEEAKQTYDEAVESGIGAAHVATAKARDSNRFTVSVNIEPESKATFYLTYEELLIRKNEKYELVLNIHPGQPVKNLDVHVNILESRPIKFVKVPSLRSGNEIVKNNFDVDLEADVKTVNKTSAVVTFKPEIIKQKLLASSLGTKEEDGLSGQFVVQYDVERDPQGGEVLVDGGYFVHFFAPQDLPPLSKHVVFILDTSGSMLGDKIDQLKEAMNSILDELKAEDIFSIIEFNTFPWVWDGTEPSGDEMRYRPGWYSEEPDVKLGNVSYPATKENIKKAISKVQHYAAGGGTNILEALARGLVVISENPNPQKNQPLIMFLTDGQGWDQDGIVKTITEKNVNKVPIFSLSLGEDADRSFLQKLSLKNQGFARHIYEAADAHLQLQDFYREISSPLLTNVTFKYVDTIKNVTKNKFPILFNGSELSVAGYTEDPGILQPAFSIIDGWGVEGNIHLVPKVYQAAGSLERLWAYLTVKQILEQRELAENKEPLTNEALGLALKYSFVTDVSSLVVVKPNDTSAAVDIEDASKDSIDSVVLYGSVLPRNGHLRKHHTIPTPQFLPISTYAAPYHIPLPVSAGVHPLKLEAKHLVETVKLENNMGLDSLTWLTTAKNPDGTITINTKSYPYLGLNETISNHQECNNSINNSIGECKLLQNCSIIYKDLVDLLTFTKHFCELEGFAGVCCPKKIDEP